MDESLSHDELAHQIVHHLETDGEYVVELDPIPTQRMVDLRWAAYQAGRMLGVKVRIDVGRPRSRSSPVVRIRVSRPGRSAQVPSRDRVHAVYQQIVRRHT